MRLLLVLLGILATCIVLPAAAASPRHKGETIWWRTTDAAVVEFNHNRCTMLLYNARHAFAFTWRRSSTALDVEDPAGRFPSSPKIPAAVRIGDTWLGHPRHPGELNRTAIGDTRFRFITLDQPLEPLLAKSRSVTLHLAARDATVLIDHTKMPALLRALAKCRRVIR